MEGRRNYTKFDFSTILFSFFPHADTYSLIRFVLAQTKRKTRPRRLCCGSFSSCRVMLFLCFRLLLMLGDEELLKPPYSIENQAHRRAVVAELDRVKVLGVKPPQNLWEYKASTLIIRQKALVCYYFGNVPFNDKNTA